MKNSSIAALKVVTLLLFSMLGKQKAIAQLSPMGALYFQNQFLGNPAMAGSGGLNLNMGIRKQWSNVPGSPLTQTLSADYKVNSKVGIGLNFNNDQSGLLKKTRALGAYAYHLPLNDKNDRLSFGLALGFMNERIHSEDLIGDLDDLIVASYNQRSTYLDGDFGLAYTTQKITIQFALPNLKGALKRDEVRAVVDRSTFFSAISYKIKAGVASALEIEPKAVYRGVNGFDNILDIGANLSYAGNKFNLFGMYHSSQSATFGFGLNYHSLGFCGMYSTSTSALRGYADGNFEIGLKINLLKTRKIKSSFLID